MVIASSPDYRRTIICASRSLSKFSTLRSFCSRLPLSDSMYLRATQQAGCTIPPFSSISRKAFLPWAKNYAIACTVKANCLAVASRRPE